jgi:hypothetical protein
LLNQTPFCSILFLLRNASRCTLNNLTAPSTCRSFELTLRS